MTGGRGLDSAHPVYTFVQCRRLAHQQAENTLAKTPPGLEPEAK